MRTQHNVQVRQVVVLPAKNVAQVTADYRIGVSAANTICGIKRRGLDGLSSIFPRYGGLETILALRARGREYWPQRGGGGSGGGWIGCLHSLLMGHLRAALCVSRNRQGQQGISQHTEDFRSSHPCQFDICPTMTGDG